MELRGIKFGPILGASGVQGFFEEGYWHHKFLRPFGLDFNGCTFVAKTTTLHGRLGNMFMKEDGITPTEFFPECVKIDFRKGIMLNAVGLSGPGAEVLFRKGLWQIKTEPFFISFMSVAESANERIAELDSFVKIFGRYLPHFRNKVGLQMNYSCPNIGIDPAELVTEAKDGLAIASPLNIPLMLKFNALSPVNAIKKISDDTNCDAICISNTIPWGKLPNVIDWRGLFGSDISPLAELGGGGLSGAPLLPIVSDWVRRARKAGLEKPINFGGGILSEKDLDELPLQENDSVFIGSVASLRPWRVQIIIKRAHQLF